MSYKIYDMSYFAKTQKWHLCTFMNYWFFLCHTNSLWLKMDIYNDFKQKYRCIGLKNDTFQKVGFEKEGKIITFGKIKPEKKYP